MNGWVKTLIVAVFLLPQMSWAEALPSEVCSELLEQEDRYADLKASNPGVVPYVMRFEEWLQSTRTWVYEQGPVNGRFVDSLAEQFILHSRVHSSLGMTIEEARYIVKSYNSLFQSEAS